MIGGNQLPMIAELILEMESLKVLAVVPCGRQGQQ